MKKYLYFGVIFFLMCLSACDKSGEDTIDVGYYIVDTSFLQSNSKDYKVVFNEEEINRFIAIPRNKANGILEVYEKGKDSPDFSREMTIEEHTTIQFIKLPGQKLTIYHEEDYVVFNLNIMYSDSKNETLYAASFNGVELTNNADNYINKKDATGKFEIRKIGEENVLYAKDNITIEPNSIMSVMQLSDADFLCIEDDEEPDPASRDHTKMRFFYMQDAIPGVQSVKMVIYAYNRNDFSQPEVGTLEFNANALSDYIELDYNTYSTGTYIFDLIDTATGRKIVDNYIHLYPTISFGREFKKQTGRIIDETGEGGDNVVIRVLEKISIPWE